MGTARGQGLKAYSAQLQTGLALCLECKRCGGIKSPGIVLTCIGISPLLVRWDRSQEKSLLSPHPPARGPRTTQALSGNPRPSVGGLRQVLGGIKVKGQKSSLREL